MIKLLSIIVSKYWSNQALALSSRSQREKVSMVLLKAKAHKISLSAGHVASLGHLSSEISFKVRKPAQRQEDLISCFTATFPPPQEWSLTSWLLQIDKSATFPQFTNTTSKQRSGSQPYTRSESWKPLYKQQPSGLKSTHLGGRQVESSAQLSNIAQSHDNPRAGPLTSANISSPVSNIQPTNLAFICATWWACATSPAAQTSPH